MEPSPIRIALESERTRAQSVAVAGFVSDPLSRWFWPEPSEYLMNAPKMFDAYGGRAFEHESAWTDDDYRGVALWLPPGVLPDEEAMGEVVMSTVAPAKQDDLMAAIGQLNSDHPEEPHWFLPVIAVDPIWQGRGIGSRLLERVTAICDETRTPAYLDSSNPRNIALYERHGFRVVSEVRSGTCPIITPMVREPRSRG